MNAWCIRHSKWETLRNFQNRHLIGWILQDFRETFVSHSLTVRLETKSLWHRTPLWKKKITRQWVLIRINKMLDFQKCLQHHYWAIIPVNLQDVLEWLHTSLFLWTHRLYIFTPLHIKLKKKWLWLIALNVGQMSSWVVFGKWKVLWPAVSLKVWLQRLVEKLLVRNFDSSCGFPFTTSVIMVVVCIC